MNAPFLTKIHSIWKNLIRPFSLVIFFISCWSFLSQAQENEGNIINVVPPSPNAFEMTRFEAQQPSLYTGTANVSIPLYTIDFDGWALPLSLSYHASGIKPNQEASEVGLGWVLNATGVISRTILAGMLLAGKLNVQE